jgi:hypothetical protein
MLQTNGTSAQSIMGNASLLRVPGLLFQQSFRIYSNEIILNFIKKQK